MRSLLLVFILLLFPLSVDASADDSDEPLPMTRSGGDYVLPTTQPLRGSLWVDFGYGLVEDYFNQEGDRTELGQVLPEMSTSAQIQTYVLQVGGSYAALRLDGMSLSVGANLGLVQQQLTMSALPEFGVPDLDLSSGFSPQNATLFVEGAVQGLAVRAGYIVDLGTEDDEETFHNSDGQDALLLEGSVEEWLGAVRLFGGATYVHRLEGSGHGITEGDYDYGNVFSLNTGAGYDFGDIELGAALIYRRASEGHVQGIDGGTLEVDPGFANDFDRTDAVSIAPFVTYSPQAEPYSLFLKGAVQREYVDYGFAVAGENDIAPQMGFTLGGRYNL